MSEQWLDLLKLIKAGDTPGTARTVAGLDEAARKAVAAELPPYVAAQREVYAGRFWEWQGQLPPLVMAGAGCLGGAAAVASWIFRREFRWRPWRPDDSARLLGLIGMRPEAWQRDLARRMVLRLRITHTDEWTIAADLVRATGIEPPDSDAFLYGWVGRLGSVAAGDPLTPHLAHRVLETAGLREVFAQPQLDAVLKLIESGALDRAEVLGQVIGRLLRDGPDAPPVLAELHERLAPDLDEVAGRVRDYAAILPIAPVAVADVALARLRQADEAGRVEDDLFAEAAGALAFRREKKLVRAAVAWAVEAAARTPERIDAALCVLAEVFRQDALVLQERAVRGAVRLAGHAGEEGRRAVLEAAAGLPADLREKVSAGYGEAVEPETAEVPVLVASPAPSLPPPIGSPAELVRAVTAVEPGIGPEEFERVLAGLAEWAHREPDVLREALRPWWHPLNPAAFGCYEGYPSDHSPHLLLLRAVLAFASPEDSLRLAAFAHSRSAVGGLDELYSDRARELIAAYETGSAPPLLLATPTAGTGHVDPEALLDRLERLHAAGLEPLPVDLSHALLRLPRTVDDAVAERAAKIGTRAGRVCAAWLRDGGLPDPEVRCSVVRRRGYHEYGWVHRWTTDELQVEVEPIAVRRAAHARTEPPAQQLADHTRAGSPAPQSTDHAPAGSAAEDLRMEVVAGLARLDTSWSYRTRWWPMAAPSHREVVAAHLLSAHDGSGDGQRALAALAHGEGRAGSAVAFALATGMSEADLARRAAAVDALITFAARGEAPVAELVEALTALLPTELVTLSRVVSALDEAAQAGAYETVWAVVAGLLPRLLPAPGERPRNGLADLLALGARAATLAGSRADVPGLAEAAARKGSSRLVKEARRLHGLLTK